MASKHIFYSGPCLLPDQVLEDAADALKDFKGTGVPLICMSHREKDWVDVMDETRALWKELLAIPEGYEVVFLSGGAQLEFLLAPLNFLETKAAYLDSGHWASLALKEAAGIGNAYAIASSADRNYSYIPKGFDIPSDIDYLHITTGNTIYGTEMKQDPQSPVPLIADMSSDIMTRPINFSNYIMIYGGAQKNVGTSGSTFAIVREDALGKVSRYLPKMLDLRTFVKEKSMPNTPSVFSLFVMNRTLHWLKDNGGVEAARRRNEKKAETLYAEIDRNALFVGTADKQDRSLMNVCFVMAPGFEGFEKEFLDFASRCDIVGIKGHRTVGGFRASLYNACSQRDVDALVGCMREFEMTKVK